MSEALKGIRFQHMSGQTSSFKRIRDKLFIHDMTNHHTVRGVLECHLTLSHANIDHQFPYILRAGLLASTLPSCRNGQHEAYSYTL